MYYRYQFYFLVTLFAFGCDADENTPRVAVAQLLADNIKGSITFTETDNGLHVTGSITGLPAGEYGFHVHELGDITTCIDTGAHFDLDGKSHGGREHDVRHNGDLGNVIFVDNDTVAVADIDFVDNLIALRGRKSILGRAVVLHEQIDDLGLGGHETSLTTGNAGARVACGVIGIKSPASPWNNTGVVIGPSAALILVIMALLYIK